MDGFYCIIEAGRYNTRFDEGSGLFKSIRANREYYAHHYEQKQHEN